MPLMARGSRRGPPGRLDDTGPRRHRANVSQPQPNRKQLGSEIKARRIRLGFASREALIAESPGLSLKSLGRAERGEYVSDTTLFQVDVALRWETGSCQAILNGARPTEIEPQAASVDTARRQLERLRQTMGDDAITELLLEQLTAIQAGRRTKSQRDGLGTTG